MRIAFLGLAAVLIATSACGSSDSSHAAAEIDGAACSSALSAVGDISSTLQGAGAGTRTYSEAAEALKTSQNKLDKQAGRAQTSTVRDAVQAAADATGRVRVQLASGSLDDSVTNGYVDAISSLRSTCAAVPKS